MANVTDLKDLERRIEELESLREVQKEQLHQNFRAVAHELSPAVLFRKGLKEIVSTPGLKATAVDTAIGNGLGFIGRKLLIGGKGNMLKKMAGTALQFVIANIVRNKIPAFRAKKKMEPKVPQG